MQVSHSGLGARLDVIASGAGLRSVTEITDIKGITDYRPKLQSIDDGPRLARIHIATGHVERALPPRDGVYLKNRFRENLGLSGYLTRLCQVRLMSQRPSSRQASTSSAEQIGDERDGRRTRMLDREKQW